MEFFAPFEKFYQMDKNLEGLKNLDVEKSEICQYQNKIIFKSTFPLQNLTPIDYFSSPFYCY